MESHGEVDMMLQLAASLEDFFFLSGNYQLLSVEGGCAPPRSRRDHPSQ
jgi:hypothetical protein